MTGNCFDRLRINIYSSNQQYRKEIAMTYTLPLTTMSVSEKIQMMETLWENLTQQSQDITSPTWHQDLLLQREKLLENQQDNFVDWNEAKKQILNQIR
jgi:hypothetical protein